MKEQVRVFLDYLTDIKGASNNTVQSYRRDIHQLLQYVEQSHSIADINMVTSTHLSGYIRELETKGRAVSTISRNMASLRSYFQFLMRRDVIVKDPTELLVTPKKIEKKVPVVLTFDEIELLLSQPTEADDKSIRDKAMLELLYASGIRVTELLELHEDDINITMGYIRCACNKKERIIPIGQAAQLALFKYMNSSRDNMIRREDEGALFVSCLGESMSRQGFWKIIKSYARKAGINKKLHHIC